LRRWAAIGAAAGALGAVLLFAPASWLADRVSRATGQQVWLADSRGTVWDGSAQLWLTGGAGSQDRALLAPRIHWTLTPSLDGLQLSLRADCCTAGAMLMQLAITRSGLQLSLADADSAWPTAALVGLGTPWNTLQPGGRLRLRSQGLLAQQIEGRWQLSGSAVLEAQDFSSALSTLRPLGSYQLKIQGGASTRLQLDTLTGKLQLTGQGQWGPGLRFSGEASAAPGSEAVLDNFLNIVGRRQGSRSIITLG
jgi:general secretion pathway protein N